MLQAPGPRMGSHGLVASYREPTSMRFATNSPPGRKKRTRPWDEHDELIVRADQEDERPQDERVEDIENLRRMSMMDYAHKCVCERIVFQIDAAR
jgi:hypothetical protein